MSLSSRQNALWRRPVIAGLLVSPWLTTSVPHTVYLDVTVNRVRVARDSLALRLLTAKSLGDVYKSVIARPILCGVGGLIANVARLHGVK